MEEGHLVKANKKDGITAQKGGQVIKFDIRVQMPKGVLWCANIKRKPLLKARSQQNQATSKVIINLLKARKGSSQQSR
jgi:hypothetical protein